MFRPITTPEHCAVFDGMERQCVEEGLAEGWGDRRLTTGRMPLRTFADSRLLFWCVCSGPFL